MKLQIWLTLKYNAYTAENTISYTQHIANACIDLETF